MLKDSMYRPNKGFNLDNSAKTLITVLGLLTLASLIIPFKGLENLKPTADTDTSKNSVSNLKLPFNTKETYSIQSRDIPTFTEAVFDPLYSGLGSKQWVTVKVKAPEAIESVVVKTEGDAKTVNHSLKLLSGTSQDGAWGGVWKIDDTHDKIYTSILTAKSANHSSRIDLNFK